MRHTNLKLLAVALFFIGLTGLQAQTVKDIDGNVYKTVKIGTQVWMAENLKTTKYNDGTKIPLVKDQKAWEALITPAYCWYDNNETANKNTYGALYNWYAVSTNKLCPTGWHISTNEEWKTLITYLGGGKVAGGKLKETGTTHWKSPNLGATNETGFTALPSGGRFGGSETFSILGTSGRWWSFVENTSLPPNWVMNYDNSGTGQNANGKIVGFPVRCLKDK